MLSLTEHLFIPYFLLIIEIVQGSPVNYIVYFCLTSSSHYFFMLKFKILIFFQLFNFLIVLQLVNVGEILYPTSLLIQ